jgi:hypothetical protein
MNIAISAGGRPKAPPKSAAVHGMIPTKMIPTKRTFLTSLQVSRIGVANLYFSE